MNKAINNRINTIVVGSIILDIIAIILSIFLLSKTQLATNIISVLIGIYLCINGLYKIVKFMLNSSRIYTFELAYGVLGIIVGFIMITNPLKFYQSVAIIVGIWALLTGIVRLLVSIKYKKYEEESWLINLVMAIFIIIIGVLLITNPYHTYLQIHAYIGIMIMLYSGIDIVSQLILRKRSYEISKIIYKG